MARPFSVFGAIPIDAPPTRTLCHGWSEPGAEVKPYQPKFCTAPGPSGPEGMKSGTVFCALELLRKGVGVSPVNGGPGEERLWAGTPIGAHPRRRFGSFFAEEKGTRPAGRNPPHGRKPFRNLAGGHMGPPLRRPTAISEIRREGQAPPLQDGGKTFHGGEPAGGQVSRPYGVSAESQQDGRLKRVPLFIGGLRPSAGPPPAATPPVPPADSR